MTDEQFRSVLIHLRIIIAILAFVAGVPFGQISKGKRPTRRVNDGPGLATTHRCQRVMTERLLPKN